MTMNWEGQTQFLGNPFEGLKIPQQPSVSSLRNAAAKGNVCPSWFLLHMIACFKGAVHFVAFLISQVGYGPHTLDPS